jgi:acyl-CoA synthetase (AMP-forming)/AMP-acid ligase II
LAFPGSDVDLVDEAGRVVHGEGVGELIARNPRLAQGYWKLPEVTARKFLDGWLQPRPCAPRRRRVLLLHRQEGRHDQRRR